jgi:hypothetical protein
VEFAGQCLFIWKFQNFEPAAGQIESSQAEHAAIVAGRADQIIPVGVEQRIFREGARRHDAGHAAFNGPLAFRRVTDLFTDRDRDTLFHESRQIGVNCMIGNPAHWNGLVGEHAPRGQRDVEQVCSPLGIVEEQLVKVAHAIEQQFIRMCCLDAHILLHHGGSRWCYRHGVTAIMRYLRDKGSNYPLNYQHDTV